ncbi:MAG: hypothetical protein KGZ54_05230 [Dethiobacter sp.]|nr:hypothetical protein [Dethiobacter sp.]MBS3901405.1 hypothetical protein [Dethiobacter sp.]MBS3988661.1 hypothetical protein [Dethiobacter sp.]
MFKGMKSYFWWGMGIFYGLVFLLMILEMKIPAMTYGVKIGGAPISFLYTHVVALYLLPLGIAYLFYWLPEQADKKTKGQEAKKHGG